MSSVSSTFNRLDITSSEIGETFSNKRGCSCSRVLGAIAFAPWKIVKGTYSCTIGLIQKAVREYVYHASSDSFKKKMDPARLDLSRAKMREFGGKIVAIQTEDGDWIDSMFFDVENFKRAIVGAGGRFIVTSEGEQRIRSYDDRLTEGLKNTLKLEGEYVEDPNVDDDLVFQVKLPPTTLMEAGISQKQVTILTQGNAGIYEMDRARIGQTLLHGQSCMVFNLRGTGRSHGSPNENRTYNDIEAVYQFLRSKGFLTHEIVVHGYCLGSGLSVELAARHPVHLILDRPFAKIGDIVGNMAVEFMGTYLNAEDDTFKIRALKGLVNFVAANATDTFVISYNNASKIHRVRGSILLIHSNRDQLIPQRSRECLIEKIRRHPHSQIHTSDQFGHTECWDSEAVGIHLRHLKTERIFRKYPNTGLPDSISLNRHEREWLNRRDALLSAAATSTGYAASGPSGAVSAGVGLKAAKTAYNQRRRIKED